MSSLSSSPGSESGSGGSPIFATTHWTTVLAAGQEGSPQAAEAWERLCRTYWKPVRGYVLGHARLWGHFEREAEDLTQGFFAELVRKNPLARVKQDGRTFRSFLLKLLQRFLINERARARTARRGGGQVPESLDEDEPVSGEDPAIERIYDRQWAETVLAQAIRRLEEEHEAQGKTAQFRQLQAFLVAGDPAPSYADNARQLGLSEAAVKMAVSRLRQRFGEVLRDEIRPTVSTPAEVKAEIRHLMSVVGG